MRDTTQTTNATEPTIDELARKWTQAKDLATLLEPTTTYFPSLYPPPFATAAEVEELRRLADAYDAAQEARGDKRRAHRGSPEWWVVRQPVPPEAARGDLTLDAAARALGASLGYTAGPGGVCDHRGYQVAANWSELASAWAAEALIIETPEGFRAAPAPHKAKARAWTDAYQIGDEVLYRTTYRAPAQPGRVHALIPARADLRTTAPDLWREICVGYRQSPEAPPWLIAPVAAMARLAVRIDAACVLPLRVVARASALKDPR